ncbi:MAG: hypothetical protein QGF59_16675, partial [Pirellulaceae bacterium]|nr:hypothetical protein [Pirellulaceae bacterium]
MLTRSDPYGVRLLFMFVLTTVILSSFAGSADWSRIISDMERQPLRANSKQQLAIAYNNYAGTDHFKPAIFDRLMPATCPVASDRSNTARGTPPLGTAIVPRSRVGL